MEASKREVTYVPALISSTSLGCFLDSAMNNPVINTPVLGSPKTIFCREGFCDTRRMASFQTLGTCVANVCRDGDLANALVNISMGPPPVGEEGPLMKGDVGGEVSDTGVEADNGVDVSTEKEGRPCETVE